LLRLILERFLNASSTIKHAPTNIITQALVVEDEVANLNRELLTLPLAFETADALPLPFWGGGLDGLDGIGGGTEFVGSDVWDNRGLTGGVSGKSRCAS
jgi:hypothetical protein